MDPNGRQEGPVTASSGLAGTRERAQMSPASLNE